MAQIGLTVPDPGQALDLLRLLSRERYRSSHWLAGQLGCTGAAVRDLMGALRALGVGIDGQAGRGHRLDEPLELLDRDPIIAAVPSSLHHCIRSLDILPSVDSTNAALGRMRGREVQGRIVLAERQERGRGRHGRSWFSPLARNVYLSVGWRFEAGVGALSALPLVTALAACDALDAIGLEGHRVKWPNDLMLGRRKLGGCLVEVRGDTAGPCSAVLGVGLNVRMPRTLTGARGIDQPWTDLATALPGVSRNRLAGELIRAMLEHLLHFAEAGFTVFGKAWAARDALHGQPVSVALPRERVDGIALGVGATGGLRVRTEDGVRELHAGEASLSGGRYNRSS